MGGENGLHAPENAEEVLEMVEPRPRSYPDSEAVPAYRTYAYLITGYGTRASISPQVREEVQAFARDQGLGDVLFFVDSGAVSHRPLRVREAGAMLLCRLRRGDRLILRNPCPAPGGTFYCGEQLDLFSRMGIILYVPGMRFGGIDMATEAGIVLAEWMVAYGWDHRVARVRERPASPPPQEIERPRVGGYKGQPPLGFRFVPLCLESYPQNRKGNRQVERDPGERDLMRSVAYWRDFEGGTWSAICRRLSAAGTKNRLGTTLWTQRRVIHLYKAWHRLQNSEVKVT